MVKTLTKKTLQLGDSVFDVNHPEIKGIVTTIGRNTQDVLQISIEEWNKETSIMLAQDMYVSDARGVGDEAYSSDPKDYDEYFPKDNDGEYLFKLNEIYCDIYTDLRGLAANHAVCITGCDRTQLKFTKKNEGLFGIWLDFNRIEHIDVAESDEPSDSSTTADSTIKEERRSPGGPIVQGPATL